MNRHLTQPEEIDLILMTLEGVNSGMDKPIFGGVTPDETGRIKKDKICRGGRMRERSGVFFRRLNMPELQDFFESSRRNCMKLTEVSTIAKSQNIAPGKLSKSELIKTIQRKEGNFDCFATAVGGECDQSNCLWRADCVVAS